MAPFEASPASSVVHEPYFTVVDNDAGGSPCSPSIASASPFNVRSQDSNLKPVSSKISGGSGSSLRSKFSKARQTGGENVSPKQNFTNVAAGEPNEPVSSNLNKRLSNASSPSVRTTIKHPSPLQKHKDEITLSATTKQTYLQPIAIDLSATSLPGEGQTYLTSKLDEYSLHYSSDDDSSTLPSSTEPNSLNIRRSYLKEESPKAVCSTAPQNFKTIVDSFRLGKLRGPPQLTTSEMRQDLGSQFEPSPEELRLNTAAKRRKAGEEVVVLEPVLGPSSNELSNSSSPKQPEAVGHRKASSGLSSVFLGVINSATRAGSSSSLNSSNQKPEISRPRLSRLMNRSNTISDAHKKRSEESDCGISVTSEKAAGTRAIQRRRILEELISSEISYVFDLKILAHVYLSLLGSTQVLDKSQLKKTQECLMDMIDLHEQILGRLMYIRSFCSQSTVGKDTSPRMTKHARFGSIESFKSVPRWRKHSKRYDWDKTAIRTTSKTAEPREAANVAKLFSDMAGGRLKRQMGNQFSVYEEYGVMYAEVLQTSTVISRNLLDWDVFERGIEGLVHHVLDPEDSSKKDKKGLTLEDLLIKPLQRICKYPLLFAELQSQCPTMDSPNAHTTITRTLKRLREVANEVNNATNDLEAQARRRQSEHLSELIKFHEFCRTPVSLARNVGQARLCGVLFVAYQTKSQNFKGSFMLCALFNTCMLLATPDAGFKHFTVQVLLNLDSVKISTGNNGTGIQYQDTPYAWKMTFDIKGQAYEVMLCAGSDSEHQRWRSELESRSTRERNYPDKTVHDLELENVVLEDIKPSMHKSRYSVESYLGHENLVRRPSKSSKGAGTAVVTIRNTCVFSKGDPVESQGNPSTQERSQAIIADSAETIVAEKNQRIRMEQAMSGVWTRDTLPYPVMTASRSEQLIRASTSLMRKLSKASIASSPSKRSASQRSRASTVDVCREVSLEDPFVESPKTHELEALGLAKGDAVFSKSPSGATTTISRRVSFSDVLSRPKRQTAKDESSSTDTVIGVKTISDAHIKPKISNSLLKALSKGRLKGRKL